MPRPVSIGSAGWMHPFGITGSVGLLTVGLVLGCGEPRTGGNSDASALPPLHVVEDRRIGSVDDPNIGFSRIGGVDVDEDGLIYVNELLDSEIRVYDENGNLKRAIGGPGKGPGEFQRVMSFGVLGDTVWAIDMSLRRITLFDRSGGVLSTGQLSGVSVDLQRDGTTGMVMPRAMRPDGLFTAAMNMIISRMGGAPTGIGARDTVAVPRVLFDASGAVVDTIGWDPYPPPEQGTVERIEVGKTRYTVPSPPSDRPLIVYLADGRFIIDRIPAGIRWTCVILRHTSH